jgi:sulfur carrier protein ThiS
MGCSAGNDMRPEPKIVGFYSWSLQNAVVMKCTVEMFGMPPEVSNVNCIEFELAEGSNLADLVRSLRFRLPSLSGKVISEEEDRLLDHYAFIVNGHYYPSESEGPLRNGDRVVLVLLAMGG